ncbi:hypothetical protein FQR65_LT03991 [Abscondita terminalis]|nr:hypothetical protein FQR65_LT03991 [Abscondita terminalis]
MKVALFIILICVALNVVNGDHTGCKCKCVRQCKNGVIHPAADCITGYTPCCSGFSGDWTLCSFSST